MADTPEEGQHAGTSEDAVADGDDKLRHQCGVCGQDVTGLVASACAEEIVGILLASPEAVTVQVTHVTADGTEHTCCYECRD